MSVPGRGTETLSDIDCALMHSRVLLLLGMRREILQLKPFHRFKVDFSCQCTVRGRNAENSPLRTDHRVCLSLRLGQENHEPPLSPPKA